MKKLIQSLIIVLIFSLWGSGGFCFAQNAVMVKDIYPGITSSMLDQFKSNGSYFFFTANNGVNGRELWKCDGTVAGTAMLYDINNNGSASSFPDSFEIVGSNLFFSANDGTFGYELWKSNGTALGTVMVKDIKPNGLNSLPRQITKVDNTTFYFEADYETPNLPNPPIQNGRELWKSDGSTAGTVLVKDIVAGSSSSIIQSMTAFNGSVILSYSSLNRNLAQATTANFQQIVAPNNTTPMEVSLHAKFGVLGNNLLFSGYYSPSIGYELYILPSGTNVCQLLKDINTGSGNGGSRPSGFTTVNGLVFFSASTSSTGYALWKTDGTANGTILVKNVNPSNANSDINNLINFNGTLYFTANNGTNGVELWKSDGTTNGTVLVKDINTGIANANPENLTVVGNRLYFTAINGVHGRELWKTDGTANGTVLVQDINLGAADGINYNSYLQFLNFNNVLYFTADDGVHGEELWRTTQPDCATNAIVSNGLGFAESATLPVTNEYFYANLSCNQLIARILPIGTTNPITGNVTTKVWGYDTGFPPNLVTRHYEIIPLTNPNVASGQITLYFENDDFRDYNDLLNQNDSFLPDITNSATTDIENIRLLKYDGASNNGTGFPNTYAGIPAIINPDDLKIIYANDRWEVTFKSAGGGGYFLVGADKVLCNQTNKLYNTQDGNWNAADTWSCGRVPLATDDVTIKALHTVTVPGNYQGVSKKTIIETDGKLDIKTGANVKVN